jgi:hypothetical protein
MQIEVAGRYAGPPRMGHGGYVAGLFASRTKGALQVTLRRPTPLDTPLDLVELGDGRLELRHHDELVADAEPATLSIDIPRPPTLEQARAAEADSPAHYDGRGVHPTCFGCGNRRDEDDALRIFAGPVEVDGHAQVAAHWRPGDAFAGADGTVDRHWVLAALDCPGAFAFMITGGRAGLLGRIVFDQYGEVRADADHIVTGWQIGGEGRKLFAGTALFDADGDVLAAARATWFQMPPR